MEYFSNDDSFLTHPASFGFIPVQQQTAFLS